jgi:hypothetical protein
VIQAQVELAPVVAERQRCSKRDRLYQVFFRKNRPMIFRRRSVESERSFPFWNGNMPIVIEMVAVHKRIDLGWCTAGNGQLTHAFGELPIPVGQMLPALTDSRDDAHGLAISNSARCKQKATAEISGFDLSSYGRPRTSIRPDQIHQRRSIPDNI